MLGVPERCTGEYSGEVVVSGYRDIFQRSCILSLLHGIQLRFYFMIIIL